MHLFNETNFKSIQELLSYAWKENQCIYLFKNTFWLKKTMFNISKCQIAGMLEIFVFAETAWLKVESIVLCFFP